MDIWCTLTLNTRGICCERGNRKLVVANRLKNGELDSRSATAGLLIYTFCVGTEAESIRTMIHPLCTLYALIRKSDG